MADGTVALPAVEAWLREFARLVHENRDMLTELDSAIGDADHGSNLDRGMTAVVEAVASAPPADAAALLKQTGMTLVSKVGGASGPLYGTFFLRAAGAIGDGADADADGLAKALRAGFEGVLARGKAEPGDKTMVDAMGPACDALEKALSDGASLADGLKAASAAADTGRDATTPMLARKGRASYLGERSIGHQDPGATSTALILAALEQSLEP